MTESDSESGSTSSSENSSDGSSSSSSTSSDNSKTGKDRVSEKITGQVDSKDKLKKIAVENTHQQSFENKVDMDKDKMSQNFDDSCSESKTSSSSDTILSSSSSSKTADNDTNGNEINKNKENAENENNQIGEASVGDKSDDCRHEIKEESFKFAEQKLHDKGIAEKDMNSKEQILIKETTVHSIIQSTANIEEEPQIKRPRLTKQETVVKQPLNNIDVHNSLNLAEKIKDTNSNSKENKIESKKQEKRSEQRRSRERDCRPLHDQQKRKKHSRSKSHDRNRSRRNRSVSKNRSEELERRRDERRRRHAEKEEGDLKSATALAKDNESVTDPKAKITERQRRTVDLLTSRTGGAYIPPAKLRLMQAEITDKSSAAYQRIAWEALKKSIHGYINKVNVDNIGIITRELLKENIVRGRGLLCRSIIQAQAASPTFTHVYAALVAIINSKFPNIGELLLKRLVIQFKRGFRRNDKALCLSSSRFIAHLVNQRVAHEILALEILTLLVENPTDDSVEVAIAFLKECGMKLTEVSSKGIGAIFEMLKNILHEGKLDKRVQYMIEVVFQVRKDGFKDHQSVIESLELVEEDDQFTHLLMLDEATNTEDVLNVFKFDDKYETNEDKYKGLSKEILGSDASDSDDEEEAGSGSGDSGESDEDENGEKKLDGIIDNTETNLIALRRTIYLTINSSLDYEECAHKLMKMQLKPGQEIELCHMFLDCCAEQRTYEKFYGLLAQRFCAINKIYIEPFENIFKDTYHTTHRLDANRLRNVSKFFAHLLFTDAIGWDVLECIKLNEDDTTSSSRIFIKILFQELAEYMGLGKLNTKLKAEELSESLVGVFPKDNPRNTRFAINFFTSIGLGGLTDELRHFLKSAPKNISAINAEILTNGQTIVKSSSSSSSSTSSSSSSSDSSDSSSSPSSVTSSSKSSESSSEDTEHNQKKRKKYKSSKKDDKKSKSSKIQTKKSKLKQKANAKKRKRNKSSSSSGSQGSSSDSDSSSSSSYQRNHSPRKKKIDSNEKSLKKANNKNKENNVKHSSYKKDRVNVEKNRNHKDDETRNARIEKRERDRSDIQKRSDRDRRDIDHHQHNNRSTSSRNKNNHDRMKSTNRERYNEREGNSRSDRDRYDSQRYDSKSSVSDKKTKRCTSKERG